MKLYFGHPVNTYSIPLEQQLIEAINARFANVVVVNPNAPDHEAGYQKYKVQFGSGTGYYYSEVLPKCDAGIFLPFRDGAWGAGVGGELRFFLEAGKPVWVIEHQGIIRELPPGSPVSPLSIGETKHRILQPY